jgi:hypothetical protein
LTFNRLTAIRSSGITRPRFEKARMADEAEDPETAADRLEAALERIARLSAAKPHVAPGPDRPDADLSIPEIAERLDSLIARLRAALGKTPDDEARTD